MYKPNKDELIPGTFDPIFKSLMINNKKYLADIISGITGINKTEVLKNIVYKNSEYPVGNYEEKRKTSDLIVEIKKNIINIEMNRFYYKGLTYRNESYLAKMRTVYSDEGNKFIQINIDDFNKSEEIITKFEMLSKKTFETDGSMEKYRVNLALIEEKYYNGLELTKLEKELLMLRIKSKKILNEISMGDDLMEEVNKELNSLSDDKIIQMEYDYDEKLRYEATQVGLEQGLEQGIEQGIEQGSKQKSIEIAKKMLDKNMPIEDISDITGLSIEEIENLR